MGQDGYIIGISLGVCLLLVIIRCCVGHICSRENESPGSSNRNLVRRVTTRSILKDCQIERYSFDSGKRLEFLQTDYSKYSRCSICIEDFTEGEEVVLCPCKHRYHDHCIKEWLRLKNSCPLCKLNIYGGPNATESTPLLHMVWVFTTDAVQNSFNHQNFLKKIHGWMHMNDKQYEWIYSVLI